MNSKLREQPMSDKTHELTQEKRLMSKLILHYDDQFSYEMLLRCFNEYQESESFKRTGTDSITVYSNQVKHYTAYFKRNKSGSITAKCWKEPNHAIK